MRDVIDLRRLEAMSAQDAAALLAARLSDATGPQDSELLDQWLAQAEQHRLAWDQVRGALLVFDASRNDESLADLRQAARAAGPAERPHFWDWAAAAAVVMAIVGGAYNVADWPGAPPDRVATAPMPPSSYVTGKGEVRDIALPDGSRMTLDTDSAVRLAFAEGRRNLVLDRGRASFAVKHDAGRPFAVEAGAHAVVVLGTRFDVRLDPALFQVVVSEGRVSVSGAAGSKPLVLGAGEQLVERPGAAAAVSPADGGEEGSWRRGVLSFHDEPLSAVVAELNRYTDDRLVVRDRALAGLHITGVFRTGDVARFGRTIVEVYPLRLVRRGENEWEIVAADGTARENRN